MNMQWIRQVGLVGGLLLLGNTSAFAGPVRYAGEPGHAESPMWSLDGSFLTFEVNAYKGSIDMFMTKVTGDVAADATQLKLPGSSSAPFGGSSSVVTSATWHPQGVVVFEATNQGGDYRLYYRQAGGGGVQPYLDANTLPGKLTFPTVSADGSQLAFIASATGNGDIYAQNAMTKAVTRLTTTEATEAFPQFSRDGKRLLFTRKANGTEDIFELVLGSTTVNSVIAGSGDQSRPIYGAGTSVIYFDGARGEGLWDLAIVPSAGSKPVTLARDVKLPTRGRPAVSPDGKWVAFGTSDPNRDDRIFVAATDGSGVKEIRTGMKGCQEPALTVRGGRVMLAFTALPPDQADWRSLIVMDITDKM